MGMRFLYWILFTGVLSSPDLLFAQVLSFEYYLDKYEVICDKADASYVGYYDYEDTVFHRGTLTLTSLEGIILVESEREGVFLQTREGRTVRYYDNGRIRSVAEYADNKLHGSIVCYHPSGVVKRKDRYEYGKLSEGSLYQENGAIEAHYPFESEVYYPGDEKAFAVYLSQKIRYPAVARESGVQGKVYVSVFVDEYGRKEKVVVDSVVTGKRNVYTNLLRFEADGVLIEEGLTDRQMLTHGREKYLGELMDSEEPGARTLAAEAYRVMMTIEQWQPRTLEGVNVPGVFRMPVRYRLD